MFLYIQLMLYIVYCSKRQETQDGTQNDGRVFSAYRPPASCFGLREGERDRRGPDGFTAFPNAAIKGVVLCSTVPLRQSHAESKKAQPQDPLELISFSL